MSIITNHWSASGPVRLKDYHVEIARTGELDSLFLHDLRALALMSTGFYSLDWARLTSLFTVWKNDALTGKTDYGTWDNNTDLRDGSPNIEVASMCMSGATTTDYGSEPFTIAHAWMHAGVCARICSLKGLNPLGSFDPSVAPNTLQNGPIFVVSTHGERAIQTIDFGVPGGAASSEAASQEFGYFVGSGDPQSRWDLAVLDPEYLAQGQTVSVAQAHKSAAWIRIQANAIMQQGHTIAGFPGGMWNLNGAESP